MIQENMNPKAKALAEKVRNSLKKETTSVTLRTHSTNIITKTGKSYADRCKGFDASEYGGNFIKTPHKNTTT